MRAPLDPPPPPILQARWVVTRIILILGGLGAVWAARSLRKLPRSLPGVGGGAHPRGMGGPQTRCRGPLHNRILGVELSREEDPNFPDSDGSYKVSESTTEARDWVGVSSPDTLEDLDILAL